MFKKIVVGIDGSDCSEAAFKVALTLAKPAGSSVEICHVVDPIAILGANPPSPMLSAQVEDARQAAQLEVDRAVVRAMNAGVPADGCVAEGDPPYELLVCATKARADAIVVGTHGRSGLNRMLVGSVAESILRSASIPVVAVREKKRIGAAKAEATP